MSTNVSANVVLLGAASVGKTSIVSRAVTDTYNPNQESTVGAQFSAKTVTVGATRVLLKIRDTAGQERYRALMPMYFRDAHVAVIVYSVTDRLSLNEVRQYYSDLMENFSESPLVYLVANKTDLTNDRNVTTAEGSTLAESLGDVTFYETSAKTGQNIQELFADIADRLAEISSTGRQDQVDTAQVLVSDKPRNKKCTC